jgi:hypothetical protein
MLARLATFNSTPANDDDPKVKLLRETLIGTPGFVAGFHLRDPETGKAFSLTVYEDANAAKAAGQRMQARPADRRVGVEPDTVEWLDAHPFQAARTCPIGHGVPLWGRREHLALHDQGSRNARNSERLPARQQGLVFRAAKLATGVRGVGISAALQGRLALHGLDGRSRAQTRAPSSRHCESLHSKPAAGRARTCDTDGRPHRRAPRGGAHQTPIAGRQARAARRRAGRGADRSWSQTNGDVKGASAVGRAHGLPGR